MYGPPAVAVRRGRTTAGAYGRTPLFLAFCRAIGRDAVFSPGDHWLGGRGSRQLGRRRRRTSGGGFGVRCRGRSNCVALLPLFAGLACTIPGILTPVEAETNAAASDLGLAGRRRGSSDGDQPPSAVFSPGAPPEKGASCAHAAAAVLSVSHPARQRTRSASGSLAKPQSSGCVGIGMPPSAQLLAGCTKFRSIDGPRIESRCREPCGAKDRDVAQGSRHLDDVQQERRTRHRVPFRNGDLVVDAGPVELRRQAIRRAIDPSRISRV